MEALVVNLERCEMCCGLENNLRLQKSGVLETYTHAKRGHWKMISLLRAFIFLSILRFVMEQKVAYSQNKSQLSQAIA